MSPRALNEVIGQSQPEYTKATILQALHTPQGVCKVWIVVEDFDDIEVSENEKGQKGCIYVEKIVTEILRTNPRALIFGIRDMDYTRYEDPSHVFPPSVFVTDYRDIEMVMFSAPSVITALTAWKPRFHQAMGHCLPVARYIGYMRICNHLRNLGCNFKKKVRPSAVWNDAEHDLYPNWPKILLRAFLNNCHVPFSLKEGKAIIRDKSLGTEDWKYICQGHDLVKLLHHDLSPNENIRSHMAKTYSMEDFRQTRLYAEISRWAANCGVDIMR